MVPHEPEHVAAPNGASLGYLFGTTRESSELQPVFVTMVHQKCIFGAKLESMVYVEGDPTTVRSRLVATDTNSYAMEDISQSTFQ